MGVRRAARPTRCLQTPPERCAASGSDVPCPQGWAGRRARPAGRCLTASRGPDARRSGGGPLTQPLHAHRQRVSTAVNTVGWLLAVHVCWSRPVSPHQSKIMPTPEYTALTQFLGPLGARSNSALLCSAQHAARLDHRLAMATLLVTLLPMLVQVSPAHMKSSSCVYAGPPACMQAPQPAGASGQVPSQDAVRLELSCGCHPATQLAD